MKGRGCLEGVPPHPTPVSTGIWLPRGGGWEVTGLILPNISANDVVLK